MIKGFKDFVFRGNIVDLAVAIAIGTAFVALIGSFTNSFIYPLIALIGGGGPSGLNFTIDNQVFAIGAFITAIITFLITAAVIYFAIVVPMGKLQGLGKAGAEPEPEDVPEDIALLREIRDSLRARP